MSHFMLAHRALSRDHVIPQSCGGGRSVELHNLVGALQNQSPKVSQSGMRVRSVCIPCNSSIGSWYDSALAEFHGAVSAARTSGRTPPKFVGRPLRIARALAAHVLASYLPEDIASQPLKPATMMDGLRNFVLTPDEPAPPELDLRWWLYGGTTHVVITAAGLTLLSRMRDDYRRLVYGPRDPVMGAFLKFAPLGFWLIWDKPLDVQVPRLTRFPLHRSGASRLDDVRGIPSPRFNPPDSWPEVAIGDEIMLFTDEATMMGRPRPPKRSG